VSGGQRATLIKSRERFAEALFIEYGTRSGADDANAFHLPHCYCNTIVEHVAGVEDYHVAQATFHAACERWPGVPITLRQGASY